jgi:hypothetical protein
MKKMTVPVCRCCSNRTSPDRNLHDCRGRAVCCCSGRTSPGYNCAVRCCSGCTSRGRNFRSCRDQRKTEIERKRMQ